MVGPEVDGSGGATASSGGATTGNAATALELKRGGVGATNRFTRVQGTLRHDSEAPRSPEAENRGGGAEKGKTGSG